MTSVISTCLVSYLFKELLRSFSKSAGIFLLRQHFPSARAAGTGQETFLLVLCWHPLIWKICSNSYNPVTKVTRDQQCVNQMLPGVTESLIMPSIRILTQVFLCSTLCPKHERPRSVKPNFTFNIASVHESNLYVSVSPFKKQRLNLSSGAVPWDYTHVVQNLLTAGARAAPRTDTSCRSCLNLL